MKFRYQNDLEKNANIKSTWDNINNTNDESKYEKVCINLTSWENSANLVKITTLITTGRIHIQGRNVREWGSEEFQRINNNTVEKSDWMLLSTKYSTAKEKQKHLTVQLPLIQTSLFRKRNL
jgi:hypothetical protein